MPCGISQVQSTVGRDETYRSLEYLVVLIRPRRTSYDYGIPIKFGGGLELGYEQRLLVSLSVGGTEKASVADIPLPSVFYQAGAEINVY